MRRLPGRKPHLVHLVLTLGVIACGETGNPPPAPSPTAQIYEVRGIVRQLPTDPDAAGAEILIRHEAIPDFVEMNGETSRMGAMSMPFPIDDSKLLEGLEPGDKVTFEFAVDWEGSPPLRLLKLSKLPAETILELDR